MKKIAFLTLVLFLSGCAMISTPEPIRSVEPTPTTEPVWVEYQPVPLTVGCWQNAEKVWEKTFTPTGLWYELPEDLCSDAINYSYGGKTVYVMDDHWIWVGEMKDQYLSGEEAGWLECYDDGVGQRVPIYFGEVHKCSERYVGVYGHLVEDTHHNFMAVPSRSQE